MVTILGVKFLTVEEAAKMLGVTKRTLYNWKNQPPSSQSKSVPVLNPVTAPNGRKYFKEEEVLRVLTQCWGVTLPSEPPASSSESSEPDLSSAA